MERNNNEHQVIIAIEFYQNLLNMADRNKYDTSKIERHVRKFNQFLQRPHQQRIKQFEEERSRMIRASRIFIERFRGKIMFAAVEMGSARRDDSEVYRPVIVKKINRDRRYISIIPEDEIHWNKRQFTKVCPSTLRNDLPENYVRGEYFYKKLYIMKGSEYDTCLSGINQ